MPDLKINDEGVLVDADGKPVEINGEAVKVTNAKTQEQLEKTLKERLARQQDRIKTLEEQANKTPELEKLLKEAQSEKAEIEAQLKDAKDAAQREVEQTVAKLTKQATETAAALEAERQARVRDQVTAAILGISKDTFINPANDVVPKLIGAHKREPAKDKDGKTIEGQYVDLFKATFKDEKGNEVTEHVPLDKAIELFANDPANAHYVRGARTGGSGGGKYVNTTNLKRSEMSAAQKAEFVDKHGLEAFQGLPA